VIFNSAEEFLENSSAQSFDLVLLDVMLPGIDGLACLTRIQDKAVHASPPRVVIMTALNDATKKQEALTNGAEDYVLKPDLFERLPELLHPAQRG
jgi:DNA-binding response OmpR family regulator